MFLNKRKNKIQIFDNFDKKYQRRLALVYGLNPNQLNDFFVKLFLSDEKTPYEKNNLKDEIVDYLKKFFVADFAKKHNFDPQKVYELFPLYKRYAEVDEFDKLTHNLQSSLNLLTQFAFAKRDEIPTANIGSGILSVVGVFLSGLTLDLSYQKAKQKDQEKINELTQAQFEQIRTEKTQIFAQENGFASGEEMVQFLEENSFVVTKQDALNNFSSSQMQAFAESHNFVSYDELSTYILQNVEVVEKTRTIFNPATKTTYRQKYTTYEGSKEDVALYKERQTFENELSSALRDKISFHLSVDSNALNGVRFALYRLQALQEITLFARLSFERFHNLSYL